MVGRNFAGFSVSDFWAWTLVTWTWTVAGLALAAVTLKRNWRRDLERAVVEGWRGKWEAFLHGSAEWRESLRRRVLAANAYQWLVEQDRRPVLQAWGFMASVCAFWLLGRRAWPQLWPSTVNLFTTAIVLLTGIDVLAAHAAARRMAADRRDGALELLLTTVLSPGEMLTGQRAALRHQFRPVKCGLFGLLVGMGLAGLLTRHWTTPGLRFVSGGMVRAVRLVLAGRRSDLRHKRCGWPQTVDGPCTVSFGPGGSGTAFGCSTIFGSCPIV